MSAQLLEAQSAIFLRQSAQVARSLGVRMGSRAQGLMRNGAALPSLSIRYSGNRKQLPAEMKCRLKPLAAPPSAHARFAQKSWLAARVGGFQTMLGGVEKGGEGLFMDAALCNAHGWPRPRFGHAVFPIVTMCAPGTRHYRLVRHFNGISVIAPKRHVCPKLHSHNPHK